MFHRYASESTTTERPASLRLLVMEIFFVACGRSLSVVSPEEIMSCSLCGRFAPFDYTAADTEGLVSRATTIQCAQVRCCACGTVQCFSNGTARGCCRYCHYGRLPGWSFAWRPSVCSYKGCNEPAVYAFLPGSKTDCCKRHGDAILARKSKRDSK